MNTLPAIIYARFQHTLHVYAYTRGGYRANRYNTFPRVAGASLPVGAARSLLNLITPCIPIKDSLISRYFPVVHDVLDGQREIHPRAKGAKSTRYDSRGRIEPRFLRGFDSAPRPRFNLIFV